MKRQKMTFFKILIVYFGFVQGIHIVAITLSFILMTRTGELTLLAPPPASGWTLQARHFLVGLGSVDFINAWLVLLFIYGYFGRRRWWFRLGTLTLTVSHISAIVYAYGTIAGGAWQNNQANYSLLVILFIPVAVLFVKFTCLGVRSVSINE